MKARLKAHLKDRHTGLWTRFSVYFTTDPGHLKELESLVLRIANPTGNRVKGKLPGSSDQKRLLERMIKQDQEQVRHGLLGKPMRAVAKERKAIKSNGPPTQGTRHLRGTYKGVRYHALLRKDGTVSINGEVYNSLSAAGRAVRKRGTNGRYFWRLKNDEGEWVRINSYE